MAQRSNQAGAGPRLGPLIVSWIVVLAIVAVEFTASFLPMGRSARPLLMLPAILAIAIVAFAFMDLAKGSVLVRAFAVAGLFWLVVLLALGSMDPMTRTNYPVKGAPGEAAQ